MTGSRPAPTVTAPPAPHDRETPSFTPESVRARTVRSVAWRAASQVALQLSRVVTAVVLARLLTPAEYGVAGMVLVFSSFVLPFTDLGLGAALVQRPSLTREGLSTVFWISLGAGVLFTVVGLAVAGPIASFYSQPEVKPLFAALSLAFLIVSFATVQRSLLAREINFRSLELRNLAGTAIGSVVAIVVAAAGYGPWALILQLLSASIVTTALLWFRASWRPGFSFSMDSARDLGGFGIRALGTRLLTDVRQNGDKLVIGRLLGSSPLGIYLIANNIVLMPFNRMVVPLQDVLFPAFSRMQGGPAAIGVAWIRVNRVLAAISLPAMLGLIVVAPDLIPFVLGDRWAKAVPVIQLLAWVGLIQALQGINGAVLIAMNRTGRLLGATAAIVTLSFAALFAGLPWGVRGIAAAYAVANTVTFPAFTWVVTRCLGVSMWAVFRSLLGVGAAAAVMVVITFFAHEWLLHQHLPLVVRLLLEIAIGAGAYVAVSLRTSRAVVDDVRSIRRNRRLVKTGAMSQG
jgi:O-antigen/teichoic acid export membrane protein